jgi:hypothetical protein
MINVPLTRFLFLDIETVGCESNWENFKKNKKELSFQFEHIQDNLRKRFPEEENTPIEQLFVNRAALVPEFLKIVCVSVAFVMDDGTIKMQSFHSEDEGKLLLDVQKLLNRTGDLGFFLCGHNVKGFDIPTLAKRMMMYGLEPPKLLPSYDTKPWEVKAIDTKDIWQYGGYGQFASLELMCVCMGVESSKNTEVTGNRVHEAYWIDKNIEGIVKYCEKDVVVLIELIKKLKKLK